MFVVHILNIIYKQFFINLLLYALIKNLLIRILFFHYIGLFVTLHNVVGIIFLWCDKCCKRSRSLHHNILIYYSVG